MSPRSTARGGRRRRRASACSTTGSSTATASSRGSASTAGRPFLLDEHLARLEASARALALDLRSTAPTSPSSAGRARAPRASDGYLRLVVTRGSGALGVSPHTCAPAPTMILIAAPLALYPKERGSRGVRLVTSSLRRSAPDALPPQVKSLNYLTSVLASIEARRQGAEEADPAQRAGPDRRVHRRQPLRGQRGRVRTPPSRTARSRDHARARAAPARRARHPAEEAPRPSTRGPPTSCS